MSAIAMAPTGRVLRSTGASAGARVGASGAAGRSAGRVDGPVRRDGSVGSLRLTWRGRVAVAVLALALLGGAFLLGTRAAADEASGPGVVEHVVQPGETLWQIAAPLRTEGSSTAAVMDEIIRLNGMSGPQVMAGETLRLPTR